MSCVWTNKVNCIESCDDKEEGDELKFIYTDEMGWLFDDSHFEACYYVAYLSAPTPATSISSGNDGRLSVIITSPDPIPYTTYSLEVWANFSPIGGGDGISIQMDYRGQGIVRGGEIIGELYSYDYETIIEADRDLWLESLVFVGLSSEDNGFACGLEHIKIISVLFGEFYRESDNLVNPGVVIPGIPIELLYPPDRFFKCCEFE